MRFSPLPASNDKSFCVVYKCSSKASRDRTVRFHRFPKSGKQFVNVSNEDGLVEKIDRQKAWERAINIGKPISASTRICSLHFRKEDYILPDYPSKKKSLKVSAVPSCSLPQRTADKATKKEKNEKCPKRKSSAEHKKQTKKRKIEEHVTKDVEINNEDVQRPQKESAFDASPVLSKSVDIGVQVQAGDSFQTLRAFIKTDRQLSSLTGIENFQMFERIVNIVRRVKANVGTSKSVLERNILMTYFKLKQNVSYASLAILCRIDSGERCKRIFDNMVDVLKSVPRSGDSLVIEN